MASACNDSTDGSAKPTATDAVVGSVVPTVTDVPAATEEPPESASETVDSVATSGAPASTTNGAATSAQLGNPADCPLGALAAANKPVDITFWYAFNSARGDAIQAQVEAFNNSQDQIVVHAEYQGGPLGTELTDKYLRTIGTGSGPDVLSDLGANTQTILDSDSSVPVGACIASDGADFSDLLPAAQAIGMDGDTMAAMPWGSGGYVLYYNRAAFTKAHLDPDKPPTTLAEIRDASKAIMTAGVAPHGLSLSASASIFRGIFGRSGELWALNDSGVGSADRSNGGGTFGLALMTELGDMATTGELTAFAAGPNPDDLLAIASGQSVMAIAPAGSLADVVAAIASGVAPDAELGVGAAPSFGTSTSVDLEGSGAPLWLSRQGDPAKVEAAYRFAKWMMDPAQIADWVIKTGSIAIRSRAFDEPALKNYWAANPYFRVATDEVSDPTRHVVTGEARVGAPSVLAAFDQAMVDVLTHGAEPVAALADATAKADAALADYNARSTPQG